MTIQDLKEKILSLTSDIEFTYRGMDGCIIPINQQDISVSFGDVNKTYQNIDDALTDGILQGVSIQDAIHDIEF